MHKYPHLISVNTAPINTKKIGVYNAEGKRLFGIMPSQLLSNLKATDKLYSFCALSDIHITYDTANADFQRALTYVENSDCLFTCICGDLTSSGTEAELAQYKNIVDTYAKTKPVKAIAGNHENYSTTSKNYLQTYTGQPLYYSFNQGNDVFVMVGHYGGYGGDGVGWVQGEQFTTAELQWLYETLEANRNKRCFVFEHIFPWGGSGNALGKYTSNNWSSTNGTVFENLMKHYKNTVLFHGHSHLKFDLQEVDKKANYSSVNGYRSIHIPSLSVPRDIVDNALSVIYAESEGYIVDVFENCIILNGRDFIDNDKNGNWLPIATYKIDTTLQTVGANTFTDTTGTITT